MTPNLNDHQWEINCLDQLFKWGFPLEMASGIVRSMSQGKSMVDSLQPAFEQLKQNQKEAEAKAKVLQP